jgi:hypothetical protein
MRNTYRIFLIFSKILLYVLDFFQMELFPEALQQFHFTNTLPKFRKFLTNVSEAK